MPRIFSAAFYLLMMAAVVLLEYYAMPVVWAKSVPAGLLLGAVGVFAMAFGIYCIWDD